MKEKVKLVQRQLRSAVHRLNARGLRVAAKWTCEQLLGMEEDCDETLDLTGSVLNADMVPSSEQDLVLLSESLLSCGEYQRCAHLLRRTERRSASTNNKTTTVKPVLGAVSSQVGVFLAAYSLYLAGEKLKDQLASENPMDAVQLFPGLLGSVTDTNNCNSAANNTGSSGASKAAAAAAGKTVASNQNQQQSNGGSSKRNPFLNDIFAELSPLYNNHHSHSHSQQQTEHYSTAEERSTSSSAGGSRFQMDGFLVYIFAVVVRDLIRQGGAPPGFHAFLSSKGKTSATTNGNGAGAPQPQRHQQEKQQQQQSGSAYMVSYRLFVESLKSYPWNWSCWLDLADLCMTEHLPPPTWAELDPATNTTASSAANNNNKENNTSSGNGSGDSNSNNRKKAGGLETTVGQEARVMYLCFLAHMYLEQQHGDKALQVLEGVTYVFPNSQIAATQVALSHYCMRDYERAQQCFESAREKDPHRIEHLDAYSNILYVREKRAELSFLAHSSMRLSPYTPETCCVVGNYYSIRGKHDRAIIYFQRALRLNPKFVSAWTLMGHECVELRNTAAAVQCYRRAVDASVGGDYRAWYGLGQTYEMLHMYQYALYYYKHAASLRPMDGRMWCAVGNCLCRLGTRSEATRAFERAVAAGDREGVATRELARLYRDSGAGAKAADCYYQHLLLTGSPRLSAAVRAIVQSALNDRGGGVGPGRSSQSGTMNKISAMDVDGDDGQGGGSGLSSHGMLEGPDEDVDAERAEALLYLARYFKFKNQLQQTELLCSRLMDKVGSEGDEARAMMREIRSLSLPPPTNNFLAASSNISISTATTGAAAGGSGSGGAYELRRAVSDGDVPISRRGLGSTTLASSAVPPRAPIAQSAAAAGLSSPYNLRSRGTSNPAAAAVPGGAPPPNIGMEAVASAYISHTPPTPSSVPRGGTRIPVRESSAAAMPMMAATTSTTPMQLDDESSVEIDPTRFAGDLSMSSVLSSPAAPGSARMAGELSMSSAASDDQAYYEEERSAGGGGGDVDDADVSEEIDPARLEGELSMSSSTFSSSPQPNNLNFSFSPT